MRLASLALLFFLSSLVSLPARADDPLASPWREVAPGVLTAKASDVGADARWGARLVLVDPSKTRLSVQFDEATPKLSEWRARFPEALLIANGSYYSLDQTVKPTCELISNGKLLHGAGCRVKDALYLGARASAPNGPAPKLLAATDFVPGDWTEALKSFPALVRAGQPLCLSPGYCAESSRTAAVAILRDGHLLFFASQWPAVRKDVAQFLAVVMGAVDALNLDGGPEATLAVKGESLLESVSTPGTPLPLIIALLPEPQKAAATPAQAAAPAPQTQAQPAPAHH